MALLLLSACVWPLGFSQVIIIFLKTREKTGRTEWTRHSSISDLSMLLNDTIKCGCNSHFIWSHMYAEMMTSWGVRRLDARLQQRKPAGRPRINADSQRVRY